MPYFPDNTPIIRNFDPLPNSSLNLATWQFSLPISPEEDIVYFFPGTGQTIANRTQTIQVPNYNDLLGNSVYSEYKITAFSNSLSGVDDHIVVTSDIGPDGEIIDENNLVFQDVISYVNLESAPFSTNDQLRGIRIYQVFGKRISDDKWTRLERTVGASYVVQKVVSGSFYVNPGKMNFNTSAGSIIRPSNTFRIYGEPNLLLTLKDDFELVGANVPTTTTWLGRVAYVITSSFIDVDLEVQLKASADVRVDELRIEEQVLEVYYGNAYLDRKFILADILVSSSQEFIFQPQMLNFLMIVGAENDITKTLEVFGSGDWTLSAPSWLSLSQYSGTNVETIDIKPIDEEYFSPGIYQNDMILTANGKEYKIPVRLKVAERFELGLSKSGLNFTDENQALTRVYNNSPIERLVIVDVEIPQIGYPYATEQPKKYQYRLGFFQNETSIHIGEIVKRSLTHLDAQVVYDLLAGYINGGPIPSKLLEYYKPSSVRITMQLLNSLDNTLVEIQEYKLIRFITGRNPFFEDNLALLRDKDVEQKVTKQSIRFINFVTRRNVVLEVYRNKQLYDSYQENISVERLYGLPVKFDEFEIGDEIEYRLYSNVIDGISGFQTQTFIVYPEGKQFNQVVYEDEYRVPQFFDFCGDWRFSTENELIQSIDVINLVEAIQNEKSIKTHSLVMNTGYIPATNQIFVEELKNSRNCWLLGNASEPIVELVPKAYSMVNYDSDQDLYQYEVEFQINPTNDLQNYS